MKIKLCLAAVLAKKRTVPNKNQNVIRALPCTDKDNTTEQECACNKTAIQLFLAVQLF